MRKQDDRGSVVAEHSMDSDSTHYIKFDKPHKDWSEKVKETVELIISLQQSTAVLDIGLFHGVPQHYVFSPTHPSAASDPLKDCEFHLYIKPFAGSGGRSLDGARGEGAMEPCLEPSASLALRWLRHAYRENQFLSVEENSNH
ncbi:hypothetical protein MSG28_003272 [Choristoneura fumiferana]|uniref:Uncharacterized protein n=1 Tax=Choristoneura fumiferana TaxID=7141 RepID=A0ACC0KEW6_CHOFU|nr:hypothetical protein MSG28_003272 [Choristoneura fumiferana]